MTDADGERIAPVTYLFGTRPQGEEQVVRSPSPAVDPERTREAEARRTPVFVDLGDSAAADDRVTSVRAEIEREARHHVSRDRREGGGPRSKDSFARINNVSMHALAQRGLSSQEMHDYLVAREFERSEVEHEVERLESVGLLDDALLAENLVRTLRERKGFGRAAVAAELRRRHVDALAIEMAHDSLGDDELERATEIALKRAGQLRSYDSDTAKRRLGAFLQRKGYSGSVVSTAVQRALAPSGPTFR